MQSGDSKLRRNILVGEDESNGVITNMLGNTRTVDISDHELYLSRVYKVIGSYYNRLTRRVYYFIFSQPYDIESVGASTSSTTTTTTTEAPDGALDVDYTAGSFQYDNMLLCYYEDSQELDVIFRDPKNYFGLHYNYPMRDLVMIGDMLYFNPRVSEPKVIDVTRAYNYTNYDAYDATLEYIYGDYVTFYGGLFRANQAVTFGDTPSTDTDKWDRIGDSYQNETNLDFDSEFRYAFNVIRMPPVKRPELTFGSDITVHSNNVRGKIFKFTYRYKYFDNTYSVYSSYSYPALQVYDEQWDGEFLGETTDNNFISVQIALHSPALVKEVEIAFQELGSEWRRCKVVNRQEQAILESTALDPIFTYDFYNNESYPVFEDGSIIAKVEDSVPKKANAEELINKNILCYAGITEGFNNIDKNDIDVNLTPEMLDIPYTNAYGIQVTLRDNLASGDWGYYRQTGGVDIFYRTLDITNAIAGWGVGVDDWFALYVDGGYYRKKFVLAEVDTTTHLADAIVAAITGTGLYVRRDITNTEVWVGTHGDYPNIGLSLFFTPAADATGEVIKEKGFKTGAFHPFCQFYYDDSLRRWEAQTSKTNINTAGYTYNGTTVYVPMLPEVSNSPAQIDTANRWIINWEVNHLPPEGAKYWRWGYAGNSLCSWFVQYVVTSVADGADEEDHMSEIDITPLQTIKNTVTATWNQFPQSNISPYEWEKGDRVRFITEEIANQAVIGTVLGDVVDGVYDYEIIKQSDDKNFIYIQLINEDIPHVGAESLVEIYRPLKSTTEVHKVYYEFGPLMPIIEDSAGVLVHGGVNQNQDSVLAVPATGIFYDGDVYHIIRTPSSPISTVEAETHLGAIHESMWWSDFYESDEWDKGKIGLETNFGERYLNIIRHSNPYLQNTQINGLSTFEALSYKELNDVFGNIVAIYELGDTLKCYQERKASSIGIGRTEYMDAQGKITVTSSDQLLGGIRYSPSNYATVFPESISRNNRYIYGFDIYNGVMWRDSANGIFPISGRYADAGGDSDYKMATWFKDKSKELLVSGIEHTDVMSAWDEEFKNLHVIFVDYDEELNSEAIVFHEPSNRWICFEDLDQTPASHNVMVECSTYTILQGFEGGLGYSFDEDTRFAMFNIVTPSGFVTVDMDSISLVMTVNTPLVTGAGEASDMGIAESMTAYTPTVHISYTNFDVDQMGFVAEASDSSYAQAAVITSSEATATITAIPTSHFWVTEDLIHPLNLTDTVYNGHTLYVFPIDSNSTSDDIVSTLEITDAYGNSDSISITHYKPLVPPVVTVQSNPSDTSGMTIVDASGSATVGLADLSITFTPDHPDYSYNEAYTIYYIILKNSVNAGSGSLSVNDERANVKAIAMTSVADYGDIIQVYLQGDLIPV